MFDENYSPNGFSVRRAPYENVNESDYENGKDVKIKGSIFQNKEDYYPDYQERQRLQQDVQISPIGKTTPPINVNNNVNEVINTNDEEVMDPNAFFNNSSQVYLLFDIGDKMKQ